LSSSEQHPVRTGPESSSGTTTDRLLRTAMAQLLQAGPTALRAIVSPGALLQAGAGVSRDSAYRVFQSGGDRPSGDAAVRAVSKAIRNPEWNGINDTLTEVAGAYLAEGAEPIERLRAAMEANVVASFESNGWPAGYLLVSAALTCSSRWQGAKPTEPHDLDLGKALLADQRAELDLLDEIYEPLFRSGMSSLGLRPTGKNPRAVIRLMHCLLDGAVLRMFVDPTLKAEDVADAILRLGLSYGEPGAMHDPRRPDDAARADVFDRTVASATRWWRAHPDDQIPPIEDIAEAADVPEGAASMLFPTGSDLADSVVRGLLVDGGFLDEYEQPPHAAFLPVTLLRGLHRISQIADELPGAVALLQSTEPTIGPSIQNETQKAIDTIVAEAPLSLTEASSLAGQVHTAAWQGSLSLSKQQILLDQVAALVPQSPRT
jgi:hypothetical protein